MLLDMPKLESPFIRKLNEKGEYLVVNEINHGYEWVFDDEKWQNGDWICLIGMREEDIECKRY